MELTWKPFGCFLLISTIFAPILGEVTKKAIAGSNEENHHGIHLGLVNLFYFIFQSFKTYFSIVEMGWIFKSYSVHWDANIRRDSQNCVSSHSFSGETFARVLCPHCGWICLWFVHWQSPASSHIREKIWRVSKVHRQPLLQHPAATHHLRLRAVPGQQGVPLHLPQRHRVCSVRHIVQCVHSGLQSLWTVSEEKFNIK